MSQISIRPVEKYTSSKENLYLLNGNEKVELDEATQKTFKHFVDHDAHDIHAARSIAEETDKLYLGVLYRNTEAQRYDEYGAHNIGLSVEKKMEALNAELDKYGV